MTTSGADVEIVDLLTESDRAGVETLVHDATVADGTYPLNDQVDLDIAAGAGPFCHLAVRSGDHSQLIGYAHLDLRSPGAPAGHLVVRPDQRRHGIGSALAAALSEQATPSDLRVWSHGDLAAARAFAENAGWQAVRELRKMRLPASAPVAEPRYPDGVVVRTFRPGADEDAWVAVNGAAFRDHPEQGRITVADVRDRESQAWFEPDGFFLAERDDELVGSHWTKVHAATDEEPEHGEVYVVGVRPDQQGSGLGKALTLTGVQYLRRRGLDVVLYVDGDNAAAVATYERIGFVVASVDVMYAASA